MSRGKFGTGLSLPPPHYLIEGCLASVSKSREPTTVAVVKANTALDPSSSLKGRERQRERGSRPLLHGAIAEDRHVSCLPPLHSSPPHTRSVGRNHGYRPQQQQQQQQQRGGGCGHGHAMKRPLTTEGESRELLLSRRGGGNHCFLRPTELFLLSLRRRRPKKTHSYAPTDD